MSKIKKIYTKLDAAEIHNYEITLDETIEDQEKLENSIIRLENYKSRKTKKNKRKTKS